VHRGGRHASWSNPLAFDPAVILAPRRIEMTSIDTIVRARSGSRWLAGSPAAVALLALVAACSTSTSAASDGGGGPICAYTVKSQAAAPATCSSPGGEVTGADNMHCIMAGVPQVQPTGKCESVAAAGAASSGTSGGDDSATAMDAGDDGGGDSANCGETGYGVTNYNKSAADDDCKYDVSWTSTPVCLNGNVYFTVTAKKRAGADGGASVSDEPPLTGASVDAEVVHSDCMTIAPNSGQTTVEQGNGVYKVGPIKFSKSGKWVVRFHFNACCSDDPVDSPHGHAAFWINVP
jgi:hypothetical protein